MGKHKHSACDKCFKRFRSDKLKQHLEKCEGVPAFGNVKKTANAISKGDMTKKRVRFTDEQMSDSSDSSIDERPE
jgi:hypothetical protein